MKNLFLLKILSLALLGNSVYGNAQTNDDVNRHDYARVYGPGPADVPMVPVRMMSANAAVYIVTVTNGSQMPISPAIAYVKNGQLRNSLPGKTATEGFIRLCQSGNPDLRAQELAMDGSVTFKNQTMQPIMPGQSATIELTVADPLKQSLHFEAMYGMTKDACSVVSINGHSLYALKQHVTSEIISKDDIVLSGAFKDPVLPMGQTYLDQNVCANAIDAIGCLRQLANSASAMSSIRYFSSYLPSVTMLLENKYGSEAVSKLLLPTSGAVQFQVKLKH